MIKRSGRIPATNVIPAKALLSQPYALDGRSSLRRTPGNMPHAWLVKGHQECIFWNTLCEQQDLGGKCESDFQHRRVCCSYCWLPGAIAGPARWDRQEQRACRALPDSRVPSDHKGHWGHPAQWALRERQDCKGRLVPKA